MNAKDYGFEPADTPRTDKSGQINQVVFNWAGDSVNAYLAFKTLDHIFKLNTYSQIVSGTAWTCFLDKTFSSTNPFLVMIRALIYWLLSHQRGSSLIRIMDSLWVQVAKNIDLGTPALCGEKGPAYDRIVLNAGMVDHLLGWMALKIYPQLSIEPERSLTVEKP